MRSLHNTLLIYLSLACWLRYVQPFNVPSEIYTNRVETLKDRLTTDSPTRLMFNGELSNVHSYESGSPRYRPSNHALGRRHIYPRAIDEELKEMEDHAAEMRRNAQAILSAKFSDGKVTLNVPANLLSKAQSENIEDMLRVRTYDYWKSLYQNGLFFKQAVTEMITGHRRKGDNKSAAKLEKGLSNWVRAWTAEREAGEAFAQKHAKQLQPRKKSGIAKNFVPKAIKHLSEQTRDYRSKLHRLDNPASGVIVGMQLPNVRSEQDLIQFKGKIDFGREETHHLSVVLRNEGRGKEADTLYKAVEENYDVFSRLYDRAMLLFSKRTDIDANQQFNTEGLKGSVFTKGHSGKGGRGRKGDSTATTGEVSTEEDTSTKKATSTKEETSTKKRTGLKKGFFNK